MNVLKNAEVIIAQRETEDPVRLKSVNRHVLVHTDMVTADSVLVDPCLLTCDLI